MANSEHLTKLKEGVEAWNRWREENPDVIPDLQEAELSFENLEGANLSWVFLNMAKLEGAKLSGAQLKRAMLFDAQLKEAKLQGAQLKGAYLRWAQLEEANLFETQLEGANLNGTQLREAKLDSANLSSANLRDCTGLRFDDTNILHARLTPRPGNFFNRLLPWFIYNPVTDPWSELRRAYTGPNFLLTLLALIAFMLPYVVQIATWRSVNVAQGLMQDTLTDLRTDYGVLVERGDLPPSALRALNGALANLERYDTCLSETCKQYRIWQLLLGWNKGWGFFLLTLAVVVYNLIRYSLTQTVSAFREEEERSGYTPSLKDYFTPNLFGIYPNDGKTWKHKLAHFIGSSPTRLHVVLRTLFLLATLAFLVNLIEVLFTVVKLRP